MKFVASSHLWKGETRQRFAEWYARISHYDTGAPTAPKGRRKLAFGEARQRSAPPYESVIKLIPPCRGGAKTYRH